MEILKEFKDKNVLLLQSQFIFFWRLSKDLKKIAKSVHKINFNGGDWIFYPFGAVNYTGKPNALADFLINYVKTHKIDTVIMFNDCKPVHKLAKEVLNSSMFLNKVTYYVFEQGYIRPDYITFEKGGVNGFSSLPKNPEFYRNIKNITPPNTIKVGSIEFNRFIQAFIYFIFFIILKPIFKSSDYSVPKLFYYALNLLKGRILNKYYDIKQKREVNLFVNQNKSKYYFVPLQASVDSQIRVHSDYKNVYEFIEDVMISFSEYAPKDTYLVFKHHPFELGLNNYECDIYKLSLILEINERVKYFKTGDVDLLIANCIGSVLVNSTVGMNVLRHKKPLKVMGRAIYNIEGIVYKGILNNFWNDAFTFSPDNKLIDKFISYVIHKTQINGSFYKRITKDNHCGLNFYPDFVMSPCSIYGENNLTESKKAVAS